MNNSYKILYCFFKYLKINSLHRINSMLQQLFINSILVLFYYCSKLINVCISIYLSYINICTYFVKPKHPLFIKSKENIKSPTPNPSPQGGEFVIG